MFEFVIEEDGQEDGDADVGDTGTVPVDFGACEGRVVLACRDDDAHDQGQEGAEGEPRSLIGQVFQVFALGALDLERRDHAIAAAGAGKTNKSSQLRKFYDELVMWHDKLAFEKTADARAAKYRELAPFIKMMNAKVAYARGRGHVDQNFEQLFSHLIRQIACPATLKNAKLFMEAVLGFLKAEEK